LLEFTWQSAQVVHARAWLPLKMGKLCVKVAPAKVVVVWQFVQVVGNPAAAWLGFVTLWYCAW
jgi:hypothetical protein